MKCSVANCHNNRSQNSAKLSYFAFPENAALRKKWIQFCGRSGDFNATAWKICHIHFKDKDIEGNMKFEMGLSGKRYLRQGAIPCIKYTNFPHGELIHLDEHIETVSEILSDSSAPESIDGLYSETKIEPEEIHMDSDYITPDIVSGLDFVIEQVKHMRKEIKTWKRENKMLEQKLWSNKRKQEKEIKKLEQKFVKASLEKKSLDKQLLEIFTEGQISQIKTGGDEQTWTEKDIANSITLYKAGPKCYKLLTQKKFPFPCIHTLQRCAPDKMEKELS